MADLIIMRRLLAVLGTEVGRGMFSCSSCGRGGKLKPTHTGPAGVRLWCGDCRSYSDVDLDLLQRAETEIANRVRRQR